MDRVHDDRHTGKSADDPAVDAWLWGMGVEYVDALTMADLRSSAIVAGINGVVILAFFRTLVLTTFDTTLARTLGVSSLLMTYLLMLQTSATSVTSFRAVGVFLFLSFLVGPVIIARLFTHRLSRMLMIAPLIGTGASLCAVAFSRHCLTV